MRRATTHRVIQSSLVTVVVTATSLGALSLPAQAADVTADDLGGLQTATSACTDGDVVMVGADIAATTATVTTGCTMTLDLNGHALTIASVAITPGTTLTINGGTDETGALTALATDFDGAGIRTAGASLVIDSGTISARGYLQEFGVFGPSGGAGIGGTSSFDEFSSGGTTTINGGTVTATGGQDAAGIGGGAYGNGGTTTINGGAVTATGQNTAGFGNSNGAGIGGGVGGDGGTVTIDGGDVDVTGGLFAAAIGGGNSGNGGTTTIGDRAHLKVTGGMGGAGIGGGPRGAGGVTTIDEGADVTAAGGDRQEGGTDIPAIGPGVFYNGLPEFGTLTVSGTLRIPASANLTIPDGDTVEVASTGLITGTTDETDGGQIYGPGTIDNAGSIDLPDAQVLDVSTPADITDHHYAVSFDTQGGSTAPSPVTVFAASFADGARQFPTAPTKAGLVFDEWNSQADGSGVPIDAESSLPGTATVGPLALTAYAQYAPPAISGLAPTISGTPREGRTLTANPGALTPGDATRAYQWLENGRAITGATQPTLKPGKRQAARRISVRITASATGTPSVTKTSIKTAYVSSSKRRLVVSNYRVVHRARFTVAATGLRAGQRYTIWLGGRNAYTGRVDNTGTVHRSVRFHTAIKPGTRRVRVSGYTRSARRDYTIYTSVTYLRK